jgi:hypothetical protein
MERRINAVITNYINKLKSDAMKYAQQLNITNNDGVQNILQFVSDYERLELKEEHFAKRQRIKHVVPPEKRCNGRRGEGTQCTRRKQDGKEYCGTHAKTSALCELVSDDSLTASTHNATTSSSKTLEVWSEEIKGIMYYIDAHGTVYDAEDIVCNKPSPRVLGTYNKETGVSVWV